MRIKDNSTEDERYECDYCKFKWRYLTVYSSICKLCNEFGINAFKKIQKDFNTYVKCNLCENYHLESKYAAQRMLVLW